MKRVFTSLWLQLEVVSSLQCFLMNYMDLNIFNKAYSFILFEQIIVIISQFISIGSISQKSFNLRLLLMVGIIFLSLDASK
mmetsp:Transcript_29950/g.42737  ORF Transcript_29950/g.42737 Transcript_29950/m.42737 type:complete len:81 (+) Transcript_29950:662-904(+)